MNDKQKRFLVLRADGLSYDKISKEIGTSKSTLIQWGRLFKDEIKDLEFIAMQKIKEEYASSRVDRYKTLMQHLQKVDKGINDADLSEEKLKDLVTIKSNLMYQLEKMESSTVYTNTNLTTCDILGTKTNVTIKLDEL